MNRKIPFKFYLKLVGYENDCLIFKRTSNTVIENVVADVTVNCAQRVV
jgi:hypothetical protein